MRLRHIIQSCAATAVAVIAMPALAHDGHGPGTAPDGPDARPEWRGEAPHGPPPGPHYGMDPRARDEWLGECRSRISSRDDGLGGAVIGGLIGGFAGNRIAGRHHRTVGTVAGAAVGAVAGAAIDRAEDRGVARDQCEAYLDNYYEYYAALSRGYGYGYAQPAVAYAGYGCCQPAVVTPAPRREAKCTETVEYVYEDVPVRPKARRNIPAKRVKVVPDKRIRIK